MNDPIDNGTAIHRVLQPRAWGHAVASEGARGERPASAGHLWNAASGQFNGAQLRAAIVSRGWTVRDFAHAAGVSRACLYKALGGAAASDRTVVHIVALLETRAPSQLLDG